MICINELTGMKCSKREVLSPLAIILSPFAPHIGEELWEVLGNSGSVCDAQWPDYNEEYLKEDIVTYTISFNGKARFTMEFATDADAGIIQAEALKDERSQKWTEGKEPKKIIVVPKKVVNIVM
jgi:leucyl-tRNA synthetase